MQTLEEHIQEISRTPVLLVATDFDGTLAPIVNIPAEAAIHRESVVAIKTLEYLPQTHVAIISGRSLSDLSRITTDFEKIHLVGSHGSEFEMGLSESLPQASRELLNSVRERVEALSAGLPGSNVELKPAAVVFHYRRSDDQAGESAALGLKQEMSQVAGVYVRQGKKVVELSVIETNKGKALQSLRQRLGATAVVFLGDDITDEDAFATLAGPDLGVKVGAEPSIARHRVNDPSAVAKFLGKLVEIRTAWLAGSRAVEIEKHSMLSDQRTTAIVEPNGRVCFMCLPRVDSPAVFSSLLGGETAGYFEIRPVSEAMTPKQQYVGNTFVLSTQWGPLRVVDYLDCGAGRAFQRAGRTDLLRVIEGTGRARITFAPRLNFGAMETRLRKTDAGLEVLGSIDPCILLCPGVQWEIQRVGQHDAATAEVVAQGTPIVLEMRYGTGSFAPAGQTEPQRREATIKFWENWAGTLRLPGVCGELEMRSALTLRALCYGPTGAIAAAATTSLPEHAGGVRNWDYRYCWPRDAAMSAGALAQVGALGPGMKFLDWVIGVLEGQEHGTLLRPLYTVTGGRLGTEGVVAELSGYRGSRPVRIGNGAAQQIQLDVLGPIAELLAQMARCGSSLTPEHWRMLETMVEAVSLRWKEEDHGIWEIRGPLRHHVHSKTMCWMTVDRALEVAAYMGYQRPEWDALRKEIRNDVLDKGWNQRKNAFCATYGGSDIDASALWVGLSGLISPDDPRFAGTVKAVEEELLDGPAVYRYRYDDGLPGIEGAFNICTSWLIEAYAMLGRQGDARELLEKYAALAGPTGLFAEQYDPVAGMALGNFPQAYSHIGLLNAAIRLAPGRV